MTTEDPNVTTTDEGETVMLEPGDPGYVEPEESSDGEPLAPPLEGPTGPEAVASPQDLTWQKEPGETDAEFMDRTRGQVVESQSPSDIVPNTPQIRPFP